MVHPFLIYDRMEVQKTAFYPYVRGPFGIYNPEKEPLIYRKQPAETSKKRRTAVKKPNCEFSVRNFCSPGFNIIYVIFSNWCICKKLEFSFYLNRKYMGILFLCKK